MGKSKINLHGITFLIFIYRNVYQPPTYWEAYNHRPYKQYRYLTDPKPYHTVRELEMDRINRDKQLEGFRKRIRDVPTTDYTASLKTTPSSTLKLDGMDYGRRKEDSEAIVDRVNITFYIVENISLFS